MEEFKVVGTFNPIEDWKRKTSILETPIQVEVEASMLNEDQKSVYNLVKKQLSLTENQSKANPLRLICIGPAGSGKSVLLKNIIRLCELERNSSRNFDFLVMAYTATAARHINGQTIHSQMGLTKYSGNLWNKVEQMKKSESEKFIQKHRKKHKFVRIIIIDEASMCGQSVFYFMDYYFRLIHEGYKDVPFGGLSVLLFQDVLQLPPVKDHPLYIPKLRVKRRHQLDCIEVYHSFKSVRFLKKSIRQEADDSFAELLHRISRKQATQEDVTSLNSRCLSNLSSQEAAEFKKVLHVFSTNRKVDHHNM